MLVVVRDKDLEIESKIINILVDKEIKVVTMLSLRFIKPGILRVDIVKKFKILLSKRTDVEIGDTSHIFYK